MVEQQHRPWHNAGRSSYFRGHHIYNWTQWTAETESILTSEPEKEPGVLVEDKYAIAIISNNQAVGHIPKFLSKSTFFFLKHGATLTIKMKGERRYSFDLPRGGVEIPAEFIYKSEKKEPIDQMKEKTLEEIKKYDERRKKGMENSLEKKENKNKK